MFKFGALGEISYLYLLAKYSQNTTEWGFGREISYEISVRLATF